MEYAFFSSTTEERVAKEFAGSAEHSVLFTITYVATCPGTDISLLSVYAGEKEVLYPPCTGLSLDAGERPTGQDTGAGAGHAHVKVVPASAMIQSHHPKN